MRYTQAIMRSPRNKSDKSRYWLRLQKLLAHPALPSQSAIARDLGTDQGFVSHAANGNLDRITDRVRRLRSYATKQIKAYRDRDPAIADAHVSPPRSSPSSSSPGPGDAAIEACRRYVSDGYDPMVLVDQVGILRRAQNAARSEPIRT